MPAHPRSAAAGRPHPCARAHAGLPHALAAHQRPGRNVRAHRPAQADGWLRAPRAPPAWFNFGPARRLARPSQCESESKPTRMGLPSPAPRPLGRAG